MGNSSFSRTTISLSFLLLILGVCAPASRAQMDPNRPSPILVAAKEMNETERERDLRGIQKVPQVTDKQRQKLQASLMKQLGNDFRNLQVVDNEMMSEAVASKELNCEHLTHQAAQIRARANSLKTNLALPEAAPTSSRKVQSDNISDQELRAQLDGLDKSIRSFVTNPIFRESKVLDVSLSAKASLELRTIIELSENVRQIANRLARLHRP